MAERVGFEPTLRYSRRPLFESGTINHSDTSPNFKFYCKLSLWTRLSAISGKTMDKRKNEKSLD